MKLANELTEEYYYDTFGFYPFETQVEFNKTMNSVSYLLEAGVKAKDVRSILLLAGSSKKPYFSIGELSLSDAESKELIDRIYDGSLTEWGSFYYHPELQLRPKAPVYNPITGETTSSKFYLEMKIRFTRADLLAYARRELRLPLELADDKRDLGSLDFLLNKYKNIQTVKPVDFLLFLIDEVKNSGYPIISLLDLSKEEQSVFEQVNRMVPEKQAKKANVIVWR